MRENGKQGSKHAIASLSWSNLQCLAMSIYSITGPCPIPVLPHVSDSTGSLNQRTSYATLCDCESWHSVFPSSVKSFLDFFGRKSHKAAESSRPFPNRQLPHGAASQHWTAQEFEGEQLISAARKIASF